MSRPRFAVYYRCPQYCDRDSIIGWRFDVVRYCTTYAFALKLACNLNGDWEDDAGHEVWHWAPDARRGVECWQRCYHDPDQPWPMLAESPF